MRKVDELDRGCMAKALDEEMTFVLLGRDPAAPAAIRAPDRRATMPADDAPASAYVGDVCQDDPPEPKP